MKNFNLLYSLMIITNTLFAQLNNPPGLNLIRLEDLKNDLYSLADAHFKGRSAGTPDELKASIWLAERYRAIGLKPAGDDGTYFQFFTLWRNQIAGHSSIQPIGIQIVGRHNADLGILQMGFAFEHATNIGNQQPKLVE